jgi:hypothetical protein
VSFTIPNKAVTYPFQSRWFQSDIDIIQNAAGGRYGVIDPGCVVTASVVPAMTVEVASGQVVIAGVRYDISADTVAIVDADPLLPRFDTVVVADDQLAGVLSGTPDAAPFPPSPASDQVGVAQVFVPAGATAVSNGQIVDKRILVADPVAATGWSRLSASTDLVRSNQATRTFDSVLSFAAQANTKYRVRAQVAWVAAVGSLNNLSWGIAGPLSPDFIVGTGVNWYPAYGQTAQTMGIGTAQYNVAIGVGPNVAGSPGTNTYGVATFDLIFWNGANAGTFGVAWGQQIASAPTMTRKAGSYLEYEIV